jgi:hypothetical protein
MVKVVGSSVAEAKGVPPVGVKEPIRKALETKSFG